MNEKQRFAWILAYIVLEPAKTIHQTDRTYWTGETWSPLETSAKLFQSEQMVRNEIEKKGWPLHRLVADTTIISEQAWQHLTSLGRNAIN